jgi:hypothetical protein
MSLELIITLIACVYIIIACIFYIITMLFERQLERELWELEQKTGREKMNKKQIMYNKNTKTRKQSKNYF